MDFTEYPQNVKSVIFALHIWAGFTSPCRVQLGDTVVTSGYSTVFPAGVMVGTVDDMSDSHDGLSYLLKINYGLR